MSRRSSRSIVAQLTALVADALSPARRDVPRSRRGVVSVPLRRMMSRGALASGRHESAMQGTGPRVPFLPATLDDITALRNAARITSN